MRTREKRVLLEEGTFQNDPSGITIQIEPGLQVKYRRVLFHPEVFETLIREGLIAEGGCWDGEPTYDLAGSHFWGVKKLLDGLRAEARRPRKDRKKGGHL